MASPKSFREKHPLKKRQAELLRIREKYPDRIPVILEKSKHSDVPDMGKKKYLVPPGLTMGQFVHVIRKLRKVDPEKNLFMFVKNILHPTTVLMVTLYVEHKDEDGILYITY